MHRNRFARRFPATARAAGLARTALVVAAVSWIAAAGGGGAGSHAQDPFSPGATAEEFVVRERTRAAVAEALELGLALDEDPAVELDNAIRAIDALEAIGPGAVPYLTNEIDQELQNTFFFAARALGRFDTPEAEAALLKAIERANRSPKGQYATERKGWAAFCLGLMGKTAGVELLDADEPLAGRSGLTGTVTYLEGTGFVAAPESIPVLLAQLDRYKDDPQRLHQRRYVIRALRRIGDPAAIPKLTAILDEPLAVARVEAAYALRDIGAPEVVPSLIRLLDDAEDSVRYAAATSLELLRPQGIADTVREKLAGELTPFIRGVYYRILAAQGGLAELETLRSHWDTPNAKERVQLVLAAGSLRSNEALDLLTRGVEDPDLAVGARALGQLADLGTAKAIDAIVPVLASRNWALVIIAVGQLGRVGAVGTAPLIADRLLRAELSRKVTDPRIRERIPILGEVLVTLRYTGRLDEIRAIAAKQTDTPLVEYLDSLLRRLTALADHRDDVASWIAAKASPDNLMRTLAYDELARIGSAEALDGLVRGFDEASDEDQVQILLALADADAAQSRALFRRVLVSEAYDGANSRAARDMAAWGARRLGGDDMLAALRESVERRHGRDARVMIYLGIAGGRGALPTLEAFRRERWKFLHAFTGEEQKALDRLVRDIRAGRTLDWIDLRADHIRLI